MNGKSFWSRLKSFLHADVTRSSSEMAETVEYERSAPGTSHRTLVAGVASTVGTVREHNEDNFFLPPVADNSVRGGDGEHRVGLRYEVVGDAIYSFLVADGMGGQLAGEKASQMAVDLIPKELDRRFGPGETDDKSVERAIREAIAAANQEILGLSHIQTEFSNMGTTIVLALFRNDRVFLTGIGDSRVYRVRDGKIEQLTRDHSLADALVEAGTITREELPNHKFKHILYLYLGSKDARGGPEEVRVSEVRAGDRFLLASDGLTGVVGDDVVTRIVASGIDPIETASRLVEVAIGNQSKDNVTCMVIHAL